MEEKEQLVQDWKLLQQSQVYQGGKTQAVNKYIGIITGKSYVYHHHHNNN